MNEEHQAEGLKAEGLKEQAIKELAEKKQKHLEDGCKQHIKELIANKERLERYTKENEEGIKKIEEAIELLDKGDLEGYYKMIGYDVNTGWIRKGDAVFHTITGVGALKISHN